MRENFWISEKVDLTSDVTDYLNLTESERKAYDGILSYLAFLDSIQTYNLSNVKSCITAPEVHLCINEQISQENLHSQSYQYLIETIIPSDRRSKIYTQWKEDEVLFDRCKYIAGVYQNYLDSPTEENYFAMIVADYLLESIYFFNGFAFYYSLASRMLMSGSADIFKLINRDELSHVRLFQKLLTEAMQVFSHSVDQIYEMFDYAVQHECLWTNHIIGNDVLGITDSSTDIYTKYLANLRLKAIGLEALYLAEEYQKNPYRHLDKFADTKGEGNTKANFFESTVTSYIMSSGVTGWHEF